MKRKIFIGLLLTLCMSCVGFVLTACSPVDFIKEKIEQARCTHEWNDGQITKETTCTEAGVLTKTCNLCGLVETEDIPQLEHVAVYVEAIEPTCTNNGKADGTVCGVCNTEIQGFDTLLALGHVLVEDEAKEATCLDYGLTRGQHCSRCDEVILAQAVVPALGHNIVEVPAKAATCTEDGYSKHVLCSRCDMVYADKEIIPAYGHDIIEYLGKAATCTEDGFTSSSSCQSCLEVFEARVDIPALGHFDSDLNSICDNCNIYQDYSVLFANTYIYAAPVVGNGDVGNGIYRIRSEELEEHGSVYIDFDMLVSIPSEYVLQEGTFPSTMKVCVHADGVDIINMSASVTVLDTNNNEVYTGFSSGSLSLNTYEHEGYIYFAVPRTLTWTWYYSDIDMTGRSFQFDTLLNLSIDDEPSGNNDNSVVEYVIFTKKN